MYHYENKYTKKIISEITPVKHGGNKDRELSGIINKIIKDTAAECGISVYEMTNIARSIFRFTSEVLKRVKSNYFGPIDNGNMPVIKLKYFGKFTPSLYRIKQMVKHLKDKNA